MGDTLSLRTARRGRNLGGFWGLGRAAGGGMILDLDRLRQAELRRDPFDFVIVEDFVRPEHVPGLFAGFPRVRRHGSFPLETVAYGGEFAGLAAELEGDA